MATMILAFIILSIVIAAMAIGVIIKGQPIKGSCGGIASLGMGQACDICGGNKNKCDETKQQKSKTPDVKASFYEAK